MFQITPVVRNLLIINVVLLIIDSLFGDQISDTFALYYIGSDHFAPFQFITYMFFHSGISHLFGNMLALFIFGPWLERTWGAQRFFIFYMITGVGAGLLYGIVQTIEMQVLIADINAYRMSPGPDAFAGFLRDHFPQGFSYFRNFLDLYADNPESAIYADQSKELLNQLLNGFGPNEGFSGPYPFNGLKNIPMVGASGAVFGILLGFGMLFPNTQLFLLFPPIPVKAKYLVTFYGLYEIYALFQNAPGDNVAHLAHIGGMVFAYFLIRKWKSSGNYF